MENWSSDARWKYHHSQAKPANAVDYAANYSRVSAYNRSLLPDFHTPHSVQQAIPPGVLSVLNGDNELGPLITAHPGIHKVS
jgi:hypothetical protein